MKLIKKILLVLLITIFFISEINLGFAVGKDIDFFNVKEEKSSLKKKNIDSLSVKDLFNNIEKLENKLNINYNNNYSEFLSFFRDNLTNKETYNFKNELKKYSDLNKEINKIFTNLNYNNTSDLEKIKELNDEKVKIFTNLGKYVDKNKTLLYIEYTKNEIDNQAKKNELNNEINLNKKKLDEKMSNIKYENQFNKEYLKNDINTNIEQRVKIQLKNITEKNNIKYLSSKEKIKIYKETIEDINKKIKDNEKNNLNEFKKNVIDNILNKMKDELNSEIEKCKNK